MLGRTRHRASRHGVLLLVVLVVVSLLSIANLSYFDWTFAERKAADASARQAQAEEAADSIVELLRVWLAQDATAIDQDGGWYDNPERFQAALLADSPAGELRVRGAVVAPRWGQRGMEGPRFGLEDESGRLNLNMLLVAEARQEDAGRDQLLALPGMTESIADSILDWLDEDDDPRSLGAERDYYSTREPPVLPANGPLATIEQLLLVKGVTPELLWGRDQDRNHQLSAAEAAIELSITIGDEELAGGWASLMTLNSVEANVQPDGNPKINLNASDLETLHEDLVNVLDEATANFIIAYRQGGPEEEEGDDAGSDSGFGGDGGGGQSQFGDSAGLATKDASTLQIDFDTPAAVEIIDPLDLVGVTVRAVERGELTAVLVESPWQEGDGSLSTGLTELLDTVTVTDSTSIPGRININQAPYSVLEGIPGMPAGTADAIIANRVPDAGATRPDREHAAWLLIEGYLDLEQMREIAPYVTGLGATYRAQVLGGYESGGPVCRREVVLDTTQTPPAVVLRRDLTALGAGFNPAETLAPVVKTAR